MDPETWNPKDPGGVLVYVDGGKPRVELNWQIAAPGNSPLALKRI